MAETLDDAHRLATALAAGGVALAPTDTVYGLLAKPNHPAAAERIFELKRRPANMSLQVLLPANMAPSEIGAVVPLEAAAIMVRDDLRPRITFILALDPKTKPAWIAHRDEAGVRIPAAPEIQVLLALTGPLYATSANAHGAPPGATTSAILASLDGAPDAIWDGGELASEASTVINFNTVPPTVLRWGVVRDLREFGLGHDD